jgi:hypothetical protein
MSWHAYVNTEDTVAYCLLSDGTRSEEVPAMFEAMAAVTEISDGWKVIIDQRLSGALAPFNASKIAHMHRSSARFFSSGVRIAILYDVEKPITDVSLLWLSMNRNKNNLQTFDDASEGLDWLDLPAEYEFKTGVYHSSGGHEIASG